MRRSTFYVAAFLILAGFTILIKNVFDLRFSTMSILFAEAVILLGIYLIVGRQPGESWAGGRTVNARGSEQTVFFSNGTILGSAQTTKYTVAFSSAVIELPQDVPQIVQVTCLFGEVKVVLPKERATRVKLSAAFGAANMPGEQVAGFGERESLIGEGPASYLSADAVFGAVYVE